MTDRKYRAFYFDLGSTMTQVRDAIAAGLDDEGLKVRLHQGERLVAIQRYVPSFDREMDVIAIPLDRIVAR
jgi:hypothetical protein